MYSSSTRRDLLAQQRKAFVNPQSECRIKCLNGGFCAYLVDNPSIHTCLCLLNVFYGDRCQYAVVESTTSSSDTAEHPLSNHSGRERLEIEHQRYESSSAKSGNHFDDQSIKYDDMSQFGYTKVHQMKDSKRITTTEGMKMDENDYTEGWDTTIEDDNEYSYDERFTDSSDTVRTESSMPVWLEGSNDYHTVTKQGHPQRIYLNKKKSDRMITRLNKGKQMKSDEKRLPQWTNENDNFESQESMTESESVDDGWMISKRRRVITSGATIVISKPQQQLLFFFSFLVMPLLR
ncbi:Uncharacterized protein ACO02O_07345 [Dirofilaria immitis]